MASWPCFLVCAPIAAVLTRPSPWSFFRASGPPPSSPMAMGCSSFHLSAEVSPQSLESPSRGASSSLRPSSDLLGARPVCALSSLVAVSCSLTAMPCFPRPFSPLLRFRPARSSLAVAVVSLLPACSSSLRCTRSHPSGFVRARVCRQAVEPVFPCVLAFAVKPLNPFSPARPRLRPSGGHRQYGAGLRSFIWSHWLSTLLVLSVSNQQAPPPSLNCSPRVCS
jgi:hypothetical protein